MPIAPRRPASKKRPPATISRASQVDTVVASAAAAVARPKPSAKSPKSAAPTRSPMPTPTAASFRFSSAAASWSSSRTSELARSLTTFAAKPRPRGSPARMGMASPVDPFREEDARCERRAEHDEGARATRREPGRFRLLVLRHFAACALRDQARLELADEDGVLRELVRELPFQAARAGQPVRCGPRLVGDGVERAHFLVGGCSPVATRQTEAAARRAPIVAAAPKTA